MTMAQTADNHVSSQFPGSGWIAAKYQAWRITEDISDGYHVNVNIKFSRLYLNITLQLTNYKTTL